jgi:SAM-dependent methyltransferase
MAKPSAVMWDTRYARDDVYVFDTVPNDYLASVALSLPPRSAVLCLADGEGRNGAYLASLGHVVTTVDWSPVGVRKARALAATLGVPLAAEVADLAEYDLGEARWDVVVAVFAHTLPPVRRRVHGGVCKSLRPGGLFVLEAYTVAQIGRGTGGPSAPEMMMSEEGVRAELVGMDVLKARELVREVLEGEGHTGESAVLQVLARKPGGEGVDQNLSK